MFGIGTKRARSYSLDDDPEPDPKKAAPTTRTGIKRSANDSALSTSPAKKYRAEIYTPFHDTTLTSGQADSEAFSVGTHFRARSNKTQFSYSSGYHEAAVTTDHFNFLNFATDNKDGTHTLPEAPEGSFFKKYSRMKVNSSVFEKVISLADGFRTDTAQTILSAQDGLAAGHSGSDIDTGGQAGAHDLLRQKIMDVLAQDPKTTPGISENSVACLFGAIAVSSMAPGELARTVKGSTASLKATEAKDTWEANRNEAKARVNAVFDTLGPDEKNFVLAHSDGFLKSTKPRGRQLTRSSGGSSIRAVSPTREISSGTSAEVKGGSYLSDTAAETLPKKNIPARIKDYGMYFTEPFRAQRRG